MPQKQPNYEVDEIGLSRFKSSEEWQAMLKLIDEAMREHLTICTDPNKSIEAIRFSQGAIAAIESFRAMPEEIFTSEVREDNVVSRR